MARTQAILWKRLHVAMLSLSLLSGCQANDPPAPILSLAPAAMRLTAGPAQVVDDHTLCLMAGGSAEVAIYMRQSTATISVTASTLTPEAPPGLEVRVGARTVVTDMIRSARAQESVYHSLMVDRGEQILRLMVPQGTPSAAVLCLHQVVVTQP